MAALDLAPDGLDRIAQAIIDAGDGELLHRALQSGTGLTVQHIEQPWWPGVPVLWVAAGRDQSSFARYLCLVGDELALLTDRPTIFDAVAEAPAIQGEADVLAYALFRLEVTRPLDVPVVVLDPAGDAPSEVPAWEAARALFGPACGLDLEARLDVLRRLGRLVELGTAIHPRDLARLLAAAHATGAERWRQLPARLLSPAECAEVTAARSGRHTGGRVLQRLRAKDAFGPDGLLADRASGLPGTRWGRPIVGTAGEAQDERVFGVERDPRTGRVKHIPGGSGPVVTLAAPLPDGDGWTRMSGGLPVPAAASGIVNAPGGLLRFNEQSELTLLDARGHASATWLWRTDRWAPAPPVPDPPVDAPWEAEGRLRRALMSGVLLPRALGRRAEVLVGVADEVYHVVLEVAEDGAVREDALRLI